MGTYQEPFHSTANEYVHKAMAWEAATTWSHLRPESYDSSSNTSLGLIRDDHLSRDALVPLAPWQSGFNFSRSDIIKFTACTSIQGDPDISGLAQGDVIALTLGLASVFVAAASLFVAVLTLWVMVRRSREAIGRGEERGDVIGEEVGERGTPPKAPVPVKSAIAAPVIVGIPTASSAADWAERVEAAVAAAGLPTKPRSFPR